MATLKSAIQIIRHTSPSLPPSLPSLFTNSSAASWLLEECGHRLGAWPAASPPGKRRQDGEEGSHPGGQYQAERGGARFVVMTEATGT